MCLTDHRPAPPTLTCCHACVGNKPALSKFYMKMLAEDHLLKTERIEDLPDTVRANAHELFLARWRYVHNPAMVAAAVVDLEYWDREWSTESDDDDEPSEMAQFEAVLQQLAKTPGAEEAGHTEVKMLCEYDRWIAAMRSAASGTSQISIAKIEAAKTMPTWEWWRTYGRPWPHLRWFAMRITAHGVSASACERNWSTYEWIHNKKRNRLGTLRAEKLVRSFSNLNLLSRNAMFESGFVEWDLEMLIEEQDGEPAEPDCEPAEPVRRSPSRAARPAPGSLALGIRVTAPQGVAVPRTLPMALPVQSTTLPLVQANLVAVQPTIAASSGRGRGGGGRGGGGRRGAGRR